jgi:hypothetical protein
MAEAIKNEKNLISNDNDKYTPLGFNIRYKVGIKIQNLMIIGH